MEQEPYEFRSCPAKPESKGKASAALQPHEKTIGTFRAHAFLASKESGFHHADHDSGLLGVRSRQRFFLRVLARGEMMGDKENVAATPQGGHKYDAKSIKV